jgi:hypothetical protein
MLIYSFYEIPPTSYKSNLRELKTNDSACAIRQPIRWSCPLFPLALPYMVLKHGTPNARTQPHQTSL